MPQATFTPAAVYPPKEGQRSASVKDTQNGYWGIHPGDMHKFQMGTPVTVDYTTNVARNGKTYYNVTSIVGQQPPANPQAQRRELTPRETQAIRGPQANPQADPRKSEDIFVCGVTNSAIAHQQYPLDREQLALLVQMARYAWRNGEPLNLNNPGRGDEPPFPGSPDDYGDVDPRG
jgi:hypothetical protein